MKNKKEIQFFGDDGYEERMKQNKKVQDIIKFCKKNNMNLMGFADKDSKGSTKKMFKNIAENLTKESNK